MKLLAIARNTFREAMRDKILLNLVVFALGMLLFSLVLAELSNSQQVRVTRDLGLGAADLFGAIIAVFLGVSLVSKEIDRRTIYTIVTKPIARETFLVGKVLGQLLTLAVNLGLMLVLLLVLLGVFYSDFSPNVIGGFYMLLLKLLLLTAIATLFSTFTRPTLAAMFTLSLYLIGHVTADLKYWVGRGKVGSELVDPLYYLLPNFATMDVSLAVTHDLVISPARYAGATLYTLGYTVAVLALAALIFRRRDFA